MSYKNLKENDVNIWEEFKYLQKDFDTKRPNVWFVTFHYKDFIWKGQIYYGRSVKYKLKVDSKLSSIKVNTIYTVQLCSLKRRLPN